MSHAPDDHSLSTRVDKLIQRVGTRLAGRSTRRGFLERVGTGLATVGAAVVVGSAQKAEAATCNLPAGCFGTYDVNICYSPWVVTAAEPGLNGVALRKGPWFGAETVVKTDGVTPVVIPVGGHFGRISNRGSASNGCVYQGPRLNQNGFLWGYWIGYARQGWVPYSVNGVTYSSSDNSYGGNMCGPANYNYDCRYGLPGPCSMSGCGGTAAGPATCSTTYRPIVANPADPSDERFYLRYAADGNTFFWLVPGDQVVRYAYKADAGYTWSCVQVICAQYAPNGCRGWVRSDALGAPNNNNTPCYPGVTCPSGS